MSFLAHSKRVVRIPLYGLRKHARKKAYMLAHKDMVGYRELDKFTIGRKSMGNMLGWYEPTKKRKKTIKRY